MYAVEIACYIIAALCFGTIVLSIPIWWAMDRFGAGGVLHSEDQAGRPCAVAKPLWCGQGHHKIRKGICRYCKVPLDDLLTSKGTQ